MTDGDGNLNLHLKRSALVLAWMLIAVGAIWFVGRLWVILSWLLSALSPFLIALVVAYIFNPIVNVAQRKLKIGRVGGILVVALLILLLVGLFLGILVPVLYAQTIDTIAGIRTNMPILLKNISHRVGYGTAGEMFEKLAERMRELDVGLKPTLDKISAAAPGITAGGMTAAGKIARGIGTMFGGVAGFFVALAFVVVIAFYSLVQFDAVPNLIRLLLPSRFEARAMDILGKVDEAVGGFLRGQLIAAAIVGVLTAVGLAAIGMWRYALLVGVVAGVGHLIPYLGPVLGATPSLLWSFLAPSHATWGQRFLYAGLVIALFVVIELVDGFFSQPRIVGKKSHLHPLVVIAALVIGAQFGITGIVLAVPSAAIARVLIKELWWNEHVARKKAAWRGGRDAGKAVQ